MEQHGTDPYFAGRESHGTDSSPEVILAAVAARTGQITLGSAVTVLSSDDPVRVYERFATLDAVAARIAAAVAALGIERFDLKYASGSMPHEHLLTYIGALRHRGIPRVRALLAR